MHPYIAHRDLNHKWTAYRYPAGGLKGLEDEDVFDFASPFFEAAFYDRRSVGRQVSFRIVEPRDLLT